MNSYLVFLEAIHLIENIEEFLIELLEECKYPEGNLKSKSEEIFTGIPREFLSISLEK